MKFWHPVDLPQKRRKEKKRRKSRKRRKNKEEKNLYLNLLKIFDEVWTIFEFLRDSI